MVVANDALMGDFMNAKENKAYGARNDNRAMVAGDALIGNFMDIEDRAEEYALAA